VERGDLAVNVRPRAVVVIEGVLAQVFPITEKKLMRRERARGYNINWNEIPLKRCIYLKDWWPDTAIDFVTFISEDFLEVAATFLDETRIPFDAIYYRDFGQFCQSLRYQPDIQTVYDSDQDRLDHYGQRGIAVIRGEDF
jgi:hypothetical protein